MKASAAADTHHQYDHVRGDDPDDDADSDIDVTMDLNEKDYLHTPAPRRGWWWWERAPAAVRAYRWVAEVALLLVIIGLLVERQWAGIPAPPRPDPNESKYEGGGDVTGFAPRFTQQIKSFSPEPMFMPDNTSEFFSAQVRQKWLDMVPPGLGYLNIKKPESYQSLPKPLVGYDGHVATTSMTHQLHCLYAIGEVYAALTSKKTEFLMEPWHMNHCFDYLRQSIMCCGDVALEGEQTTFPPGFDGSDGWDAKHVCKDYSQVYAYLQTNAVDNKTWI